ncbi:SLC17 family MFS transporter [Campylobacter jejuni]|nr:SLC17 family MFS transporter [Campylobacter jejuni]
MENLTKEQKKLFYKFIKNIKDENSLKQLEQFLDLIENNAIQNSLKDIAEFNSAYNGNGNNEEMSIKDMIEDIKISQKDIDEIYWKIFDIQSDNKNESSALIEIEKAKEYANKMQNDYMKFYDLDHQGNITEGIISKLKQACNDIETNKDKIKKFEEFYNEIFVGIKADENGKGGKLSLKDRLNEQKTEINNLISSKKQELENCLNDYKDKFENLYKEKNDKIDKLLPGATSVGLSKSYKNQKEEIDKSLMKWNWVFWISISIFIGGAIFYFYHSFDEKFDYVSIFRYFPFWIFSGFFIFYSTKQIAEYKRLRNEYAYKEALNDTYVGYERAVEKSDNKILKDKLLEIMLKAAEFNPSDTLEKSKGEHPLKSIMGKFSKKDEVGESEQW